MTASDLAGARLLATILVVASAAGLAVLAAVGGPSDGLALILTGAAGIVALVTLNRRGVRRGGRS